MEEAGVQVTVDGLTGVSQEHETRHRGAGVPLLDRGRPSEDFQ
jgi:hypothetical protein